MDILYKPKFVINFQNSSKDRDTYSCFSALDNELHGALFQLEVNEITKPNSNFEYNISEIFNSFIENYELENFKKLAKIELFNIIISVNDTFFIV